MNDVISSNRLDYPGTQFQENGSYAYIDFTTEEIGKATVPYSPDFGGTVSKDWPFTGSGFTAGENGTMVPEWNVIDNEGMKPSEGSTLHEVIDGKDTIVASYEIDDNDNGFWKDLR